MYSKDYYDSIDYKPEKIGIEIFQKMSQYMPYMVFITRAGDFKLLYANRKVSEFLGFNLEDLHNMGGRIGDMMDEEDIGTLLETTRQVKYIEDDQAIKTRIKLRGKTGKIVHLEISVSVFKRDENRAPLEYFCVSEDITEKVLMEQHSSKLEIITRAAEETFKYGVWQWDVLQGKVKWSEGFWDLLEYPAGERTDEWMPMDIYFRHVPNVQEGYSQEKLQQIEMHDTSTSVEPVEVTLNTYTGKTVYAVTHTRVLEWKDGKPSLAVGSTADITSMKSIQKSLEAKVAELAKAYEEVEQFSYVASHDLQEPLRKITTFGERLKEKCGSQVDPDCAVYIDRIIDGASRMRLLIENLLSLSRTKRNVDYLKTTDLNEVLTEVTGDLENQMAAKSAVIRYPKLPVMDAIPTQMHQLFLNLLTNSLKFTRPSVDAVIDITYTHLNDKQKNEYNLDTQQDYIYIQLRDNGIGFDPVYADTIFSPFKRLHGRSEYEGTGIGLAICKKVVHNHGGIIWADSRPGEGSVFHIVLAERQSEATTQ